MQMNYLMRIALLAVALVPVLMGCSGKGADQALLECGYEMTKVRMARPNMNFDQDPDLNRVFMRALVIECMKAKGFDSIPEAKLQQIR